MLSIQDSASKQLNLCSFIGRHTQLFRYFDIIVSQKKKIFLDCFIITFLNIFSSDFIVLKIFERLQITIKALWCIARQQKTLFFEPSGVKTHFYTSVN